VASGMCRGAVPAGERPEVPNRQLRELPDGTIPLDAR
jgi:hypothetical protein